MIGYQIAILLIYIFVFSGCYLYLVKDIPTKYSGLLRITILILGLLLFYKQMDSTLIQTLLRYVYFILFYSIWGILFLDCIYSYAIYLAIFYTIFMGVCFSCMQIIFLLLNITSSTLLTLCAGLFRVIVIIIIKKYIVQIDGDRHLTFYETVLGLFPAAACFIANLVLFDYLIMTNREMRGENLTLAYLLVLFFALAAIFVLVSSERYFILNRKREEAQFAKEHLQMQYDLFLKDKTNNEMIQALYHDIKNHLMTIERMGHTEQTQTYISDLEKSLEQMNLPYHTGWPTLDAILLNKKIECDKYGIQLNSYVFFTQKEFLSSMEICTLFGNCIDNAIEAVANLAEDKRNIHISGGEINGNIVINIRNPFEHELKNKEGKLISTKKDILHHGYGLMNVKHVVEKYDGSLIYKVEDSNFFVCWMIPISKNETNKKTALVRN